MNDTKQCFECKSTIPADARKCANCRTRQPRQFTRKQLLTIFILFVVSIWWYNHSSNPVARNTQQTIQQNTSSGIYTTDVNKLTNSIIDQEKEISMVYVQDCLARLIDNDPNIFEYPFYAMKNQKGDGYIGIMKTRIGEAIFLVPYYSLNQTNKTDLSQSIKAVNGTAKTLSGNLLNYADGYNPTEVLSWVK